MGEFKGKHIGYKGFIRDQDSALCIITLLYDKSTRVKTLKDARYSNLCFVKEIEVIETGEKPDSVSGHCSAKHFVYMKNRFILGDKIYFFPDTLRNAPERAINYARNQMFYDNASDDIRDKLMLFILTHVKHGRFRKGGIR